MQSVEQKVESTRTAKRIAFLLLSVTISIVTILFLDVNLFTIAYSIAFGAILFSIFFAIQRGKPAYGPPTGPGTYTRDILVSTVIIAIVAAAVFLLSSARPEIVKFLTDNVWPILGPILYILFVSIYTIYAKDRQ